MISRSFSPRAEDGPVPSSLKVACKQLALLYCRNLEAGERTLSNEEQQVLDRICEAYYLPAWCSINDYKQLFEAEGMKVMQNLLFLVLNSIFQS